MGLLRRYAPRNDAMTNNLLPKPNKMIINNSQFITSIADSNLYSQKEWGSPEICFAGRSNVGKSSLINMLLGRRGLARVSNTPGRTRLLNFFDITGKGQDDTKINFTLVDLPGYGYAATSKEQRKAFAPLIEGYFDVSEQLKYTFLLLDIRHKPSADDMQMLKFLYQKTLPFGVIATKADKLSRSQQGVALSQLASATGLGIDNIIAVDHNGYGRNKILEKIENILSN